MSENLNSNSIETPENRQRSIDIKFRILCYTAQSPDELQRTVITVFTAGPAGPLLTNRILVTHCDQK